MKSAGITKDGVEVFYSEKMFRRISNELKVLIAEALPKINYNYYPYFCTFYFDRIVGKTSLVDVDSYNENVFWVYRKGNSKWKAPVIIEESKRYTTKITWFFRLKEDKVFIRDCYFGGKAFPLPGDPMAQKNIQASSNFWQEHALSVTVDEIDVPKTLASLSSEDRDRFLESIAC